MKGGGGGGEAEAGERGPRSLRESESCAVEMDAWERLVPREEVEERDMSGWGRAGRWGGGQGVSAGHGWRQVSGQTRLT